jgi:hypothetical protein
MARNHVVVLQRWTGVSTSLAIVVSTLSHLTTQFVLRRHLHPIVLVVAFLVDPNFDIHGQPSFNLYRTYPFDPHSIWQAVFILPPRAMRHMMLATAVFAWIEISVKLIPIEVTIIPLHKTAKSTLAEHRRTSLGVEVIQIFPNDELVPLHELSSNNSTSRDHVPIGMIALIKRLHRNIITIHYPIVVVVRIGWTFGSVDSRFVESPPMRIANPRALTYDGWLRNLFDRAARVLVGYVKVRTSSCSFRTRQDLHDLESFQEPSMVTLCHSYIQPLER